MYLAVSLLTNMTSDVCNVLIIHPLNFLTPNILSVRILNVWPINRFSNGHLTLDPQAGNLLI